MHRDSRAQNRKQVLMSAALFAALVFLWPEYTHAIAVPETLTFTTENFSKSIHGEELHSWFQFLPVTVLHPIKHKEIEHHNLCPLEKIYCISFISRHQRLHIVTERRPIPNRDVIQTVIANLALEVDRDPINAKLGTSNGGVVVTQDAVAGRTLLIDDTVTSLTHVLEENLEKEIIQPLSIAITEPKITRSTYATLGIKELLAEGKTDFRGSPKNRIYNIHRAIQQYDGVIIAPGEEFSFVKLLGEVDGEHGYLPELVIKNNKTEPEFGGGICQVSTTVFRTALNAGLKITARRNHAYPVQYYKPYGLDATIYIPAPDLRFQNNTPGSIIMFPLITGTELKFSFFGTNDGRTASIDGPHILERNPDGSMRTIFTHIVKDANGKTLIEDSFPSNYKSPSLFPHPGDEPIYTKKPATWSTKQWKEYKKIHP